MADKKKAQDSKKGKPSSAGRRNGKFEVFHARTRERKLRNLLKSNGAEAARAYASKFNCEMVLRRISQEKTYAGEVACRAL